MSGANTLPWLHRLEDGTLTVSVDTGVYPLDALLRACYLFTDRCYLFLEPEQSGRQIRVSVAGKRGAADLTAVAGEFCNELLNQRLRSEIAAETRPIRELIVAQAFAEAEFRTCSDQEADYNDDPKGIAK